MISRPAFRAFSCAPIYRRPAFPPHLLPTVLRWASWAPSSTMATQSESLVNEIKRVPIPPNGVDYRGKIVLAPMVRSGELPSRLMALKYGADLVWGPETVDKAMIGTIRRLNPLTNIVEFTRFPSNKLAPPKDSEGDNSSSNPEAGQNSPSDAGRESIIFSIDPVRETQAKKLIFQIGTANPKLAVEAARIVAADVAGIDVNAGCPKPFSTSGGMGAALLKTPDLLCSILRALVKEVGEPFRIGISVKIRILATQEKTVELVEKLCATGIIGLTVHCRMTHMRPRERALRDQVPAIVATCHAAGVACLINGDVADRADGLALMEKFGVDGAMIATAAEKNPSVFSPNGTVPWREVIPDYITTAIRVANRWGNTKFLLAQIIPGKALQASLPPGAPINSLAGAKTYTQIVTMMNLEKVGKDDSSESPNEGDDLADPFESALPFPFCPDHNPSLLARARALDSFLGLGAQVSRAERRAKRKEDELKIQEEAKARREAKKQSWEVKKQQRRDEAEQKPTQDSEKAQDISDRKDEVNRNGKRISDDEKGADESKRVKVGDETGAQPAAL